MTMKLTETNRQTERWTDGQMDRPTDRLHDTSLLKLLIAAKKCHLHERSGFQSVVIWVATTLVANINIIIIIFPILLLLCDLFS